MSYKINKEKLVEHYEVQHAKLKRERENTDNPYTQASISDVMLAMTMCMDILLKSLEEE